MNPSAGFGVLLKADAKIRLFSHVSLSRLNARGSRSVAVQIVISNNGSSGQAYAYYIVRTLGHETFHASKKRLLLGHIICID